MISGFCWLLQVTEEKKNETQWFPCAFWDIKGPVLKYSLLSVSKSLEKCFFSLIDLEPKFSASVSRLASERLVSSLKLHKLFIVDVIFSGSEAIVCIFLNRFVTQTSSVKNPGPSDSCGFSAKVLNTNELNTDYKDAHKCPHCT